MIKKINIITTGTGITLAIYPLPRYRKLSGSPVTGILFVVIKINPCTTYCIPSVPIKDGIFQYVTINPETRPTRLPIATAIRIASHTGILHLVIKRAALHPANVALIPLLRSISPPKTTKETPNAQIPTTHT